MKKLISVVFLVSITFSLFYSCEKNREEKIIYQNDTVFIKDTIQLSDTLIIYDTIIFTDTIVQIDTIVLYDTSEFSYLFKHYELGSCDVTFYTSELQKSPYQICTMNSMEQQMNIIEEGKRIYPIWGEDSTSLIYVDLSSLAIVEENIQTGVKTSIWDIDRNIMFIWYAPLDDVYLAVYYNNGYSRIIAIDYHTGKVSELTDPNIFESHPSTSDVDDWIYFCRKDDDNYNIYRRKLDLSIEEEVYIDHDFNMTSFKVSSDGRFLITPKFMNDRGYVVFYDIGRKRIIHELELPVDGYPMYATLTKDNKAMFFVNGISGDFSSPRNLYMMALDKTQLLQLTQFDELLAMRPIAY